MIPHFSCHHIRHTFCTRFCENERNLKVDVYKRQAVAAVPVVAADPVAAGSVVAADPVAAGSVVAAVPVAADSDPAARHFPPHSDPDSPPCLLYTSPTHCAFPLPVIP